MGNKSKAIGRYQSKLAKAAEASKVREALAKEQALREAEARRKEALAESEPGKVEKSEPVIPRFRGRITEPKFAGKITER